jgi:hypothetical protein
LTDVDTSDNISTGVDMNPDEAGEVMRHERPVLPARLLSARLLLSV